MKKKTCLLSPIVVGAIFLAGHPSAKAAINPLDAFTYDIVAYNQTNGDADYLTTGSTTVGVNGTSLDAQNGATITLTSSEAVGLTTTTDTFTISTPTNFISTPDLTTAAYPNGFLVNGLQFDLGDANSGSEPVTLVLPITSYSATGSTLFAGTHSAALTPTSMVAANGATYAAAEGPITSDASAIDTYAFYSITYSITYSTLAVPEPSTWAMLGCGGLLGVLALRRNRAGA